ncbi:hypothetical protein CF319_g7768 [Tilletia indica]|nr:hypothetical protein CF319_g7768 [Tilletia indica]
MDPDNLPPASFEDPTDDNQRAVCDAEEEVYIASECLADGRTPTGVEEGEICGRVLGWVRAVHTGLRLQANTLPVAGTVLNDFLQTRPTDPRTMLLFGFAALVVAEQHNEGQRMGLLDFTRYITIWETQRVEEASNEIKRALGWNPALPRSDIGWAPPPNYAADAANETRGSDGEMATLREGLARLQSEMDALRNDHRQLRESYIAFRRSLRRREPGAPLDELREGDDIGEDDSGQAVSADMEEHVD